MSHSRKIYIQERVYGSRCFGSPEQVHCCQVHDVRPSVANFSLLHSHQKPIKELSQNLTRSKYSTSSINFVFLGLVHQQRLLPCDMSSYVGIFDFFICNRWKEFDEALQETSTQRFPPSSCFFRVDWSTRMAALVFYSLRHFFISPLQPLKGIWQHWQERLPNVLYHVFCFFVPIRQQIWPPWPLRHFRLLLRHRWTAFDETWQETSERADQSTCDRADQSTDVAIMPLKCTNVHDMRLFCLLSKWVFQDHPILFKNYQKGVPTPQFCLKWHFRQTRVVHQYHSLSFGTTPQGQ